MFLFVQLKSDVSFELFSDGDEGIVNSFISGIMSTVNSVVIYNQSFKLSFIVINK